MTASTPTPAQPISERAPETPEMRAFAAFLAASFDSGMSGEAMRKAVEWTFNAFKPTGAADAGAAAQNAPEPVLTIDEVRRLLSAWEAKCAS